ERSPIMKSQNRWWVVTAAAVLILANALWADPPTLTRITIADLHCNGCAKRVADQLAEVPGVDKVQTDVKSRTATVLPRPQTTVSPGALWEAVEKADKTPVKLQGPSGTFTAKPKS